METKEILPSPDEEIDELMEDTPKPKLRGPPQQLYHYHNGNGNGKNGEQSCQPPNTPEKSVAALKGHNK
jgi:hypothetical protein